MEWEHSYQKDCRQPETSPSRNPPSVAAACLLACMLTDLGPSSNTWPSSFLVLVLYHPFLVSGRMELSSSVCHGLSPGALDPHSMTC